ncbi:MAG: hypothetical protein KC549_05610 [Myxococcales bacterium]|nr:hypothetical protein [Myxococcales bacterium]MCB9547446.1 hypothetical protein [Myxococcales bacterium]
MTRRGFYLLGRVRGAPVRLHWSTLLVAVFIGITSGAGLSLFTLIASVMTLGLILIHELGHAAMVWRYRHHVVGIEVWGFHGVCYWEGHASRYEDAAISWGGVLAQGVLLVAVGLWAVLTGPATTEFGWTAQQVFIRTNLFMIALNLLPFPPLDGARAWKILPMLRGRFRPRVRRAPPPPKLRLVKPPPVRLDDVDDEPLSEESRRIADRAIQEALEQSRRKGQNGSGKPTLH